MYAGGAAPHNPQVSPIYGSLEGLGQLTVFAGTDEIMLPDARRLNQLANASESKIGYFEYPGMFHAWPIFPIPEARQAIEQVRSIVRGGEHC
ncbi:hypothetical protein FA727_21105 [Robertmurraya kyonggiensis]|uniref:Alpha/beta hydrolase fold-3 domain-containing protein n=2 Tax=Robertmurraya kyonggiensis TaxID=1037680 RepID=A0A4U1CZ91_9BACI|nr:hypothetical protein FA727_21105 [Robertmurraya kyonggiensis]